jgi:hypothetical protein
MTGDTLSRIDFSDNSYTLKQKAVRNAYSLFDSSGEKVLSSKQKLMKMKEESRSRTLRGMMSLL